MLDGGRGLAALASELKPTGCLRTVKRINLFVGHAHLDHWEGLKDAEWFWPPPNGLELSVFGRPEALGTIRRVYAHPSYVPLEVLAESTLGRIRFIPLPVRARRKVGEWKLRSYPLNHYSGQGNNKRKLDTIGFRLSLSDGPSICYLCDHEPTKETRRLELQALMGAHLVIVDAHFCDAREHKYGHGSIEFAAQVAREFPRVSVLAGHHSPVNSDARIRAAIVEHGRGLTNLQVAVEGTRFRWDSKKMRFRSRPST